ncbi:uncharacterized protein PITG_18693 [Phytophthora infestans T30-4]|uniref:Uncharacterized protein n=1 Tax=Phytophthora infestans (strain T30-4) TaxID=403677 RepID=D0NZ10_PHYIT|nr:uncharacterized protein PITG_18693 [Phytophthora infestans T30-4]EEY68797.1 hypothetical protein PITG_18693 [Phytophthora infestans T30-4]|eukprot:XP_002997347.1 hypothetical protein PITG_18693 [Phytophthora infestans T30-4]
MTDGVLTQRFLSNDFPLQLFDIEITDIREPPRNVSQPSSTLTTIYMYDTDKAYFWPWNGRRLARRWQLTGIER